MSDQVRETQRTPRSCIPCSRRKVKCSKKIPCEQCIRRGDTAACRREVVKVGGKVTIAVDAITEGQDENVALSDQALLRENESLKVRIRQLELALTRPELVKLETKSSSKPTGDSQSPQRIMSDFQNQAFGVSGDHVSRDPSRTRVSENNAKPILPIRRWSERIVDFSLVNLGWVHCAVDEATFWKEHDVFWENLMQQENECLMEHGWMAVYLSLLAVGVYFMTEEELQGIQLLYEIFSHEIPSTVSSLGKGSCGLARTWYEAALRELELAESIRKPALSTVQAVAILNIIHKNLGESAREYILHGIAVNVARLIGLDHLGDDNSLVTTTKKDQRIVCQRLWWTLVICDWLTIWSRPISIHPDSFTTVLGTDSSKIEYHKAMARIASMVRIQINSIHEWSPEALKTCFDEIDTVCASFPSLAYDSPNDNAEPSWTSLQHDLAFNCIFSWRLSLSVPMLPHILDSPSPKSHEAMEPGILSAREILHRTYINSDPLFFKFWSVASAVISAGVFLALDLICFQRQRSSAQVSELKDLVALSYRLTEQSTAETRHGGLLVLSRLAHLYETVLPACPHKIDRGAFARIVRLVAIPRLWSSLSDADATIRFLFPSGSQEFSRSSSVSSCSTIPSQPECTPYPFRSVSGLEGVSQGDVFEPWGASGTIGQEGMVPYFGQFFSSADMIDASLLLADSTLLGDFREGP